MQDVVAWRRAGDRNQELDAWARTVLDRSPEPRLRIMVERVAKDMEEQERVGITFHRSMKKSMADRWRALESLNVNFLQEIMALEDQITEDLSKTTKQLKVFLANRSQVITLRSKIEQMQGLGMHIDFYKKLLEVKIASLRRSYTFLLRAAESMGFSTPAQLVDRYMSLKAIFEEIFGEFDKRHTVLNDMQEKYTALNESTMQRNLEQYNRMSEMYLKLKNYKSKNLEMERFIQGQLDHSSKTTVESYKVKNTIFQIYARVMEQKEMEPTAHDPQVQLKEIEERIRTNAEIVALVHEQIVHETLIETVGKKTRVAQKARKKSRGAAEKGKEEAAPQKELLSESGEEEEESHQGKQESTLSETLDWEGKVSGVEGGRVGEFVQVQDEKADMGRPRLSTRADMGVTAKMVAKLVREVRGARVGKGSTDAEIALALYEKEKRSASEKGTEKERSELGTAHEESAENRSGEKVDGVPHIDAVSQEGEASRMGSVSQVGGVSRMGSVSQVGGDSKVGSLSHVGGVTRAGSASQVGGISRMGSVSQVGGVSRAGSISQVGGASRVDSVSGVGGASQMGSVPQVHADLLQEMDRQMGGASQLGVDSHEIVKSQVGSASITSRTSQIDAVSQEGLHPNTGGVSRANSMDEGHKSDHASRETVKRESPTPDEQVDFNTNKSDSNRSGNSTKISYGRLRKSKTFSCRTRRCEGHDTTTYGSRWVATPAENRLRSASQVYQNARALPPLTTHNIGNKGKRIPRDASGEKNILSSRQKSCLKHTFEDTSRTVAPRLTVIENRNTETHQMLPDPLSLPLRHSFGGKMLEQPGTSRFGRGSDCLVSLVHRKDHHRQVSRTANLAHEAPANGGVCASPAFVAAASEVGSTKTRGWGIRPHSRLERVEQYVASMQEMCMQREDTGFMTELSATKKCPDFPDQSMSLADDSLGNQRQMLDLHQRQTESGLGNSQLSETKKAYDESSARDKTQSMNAKSVDAQRRQASAGKSKAEIMAASFKPIKSGTERRIRRVKPAAREPLEEKSHNSSTTWRNVGRPVKTSVGEVREFDQTFNKGSAVNIKKSAKTRSADNIETVNRARDQIVGAGSNYAKDVHGSSRPSQTRVNSAAKLTKNAAPASVNRPQSNKSSTQSSCTRATRKFQSEKPQAIKSLTKPRSKLPPVEQKQKTSTLPRKQPIDLKDLNRASLPYLGDKATQPTPVGRRDSRRSLGEVCAARRRLRERGLEILANIELRSKPDHFGETENNVKGLC